MTYLQVCNKSKTTSSISGARTAYPSGAHKLTPGFCGVRVAQSLVFCVVFCTSLFVLCYVCPSIYCFWDLQTFLYTSRVVANSWLQSTHFIKRNTVLNIFSVICLFFQEQIYTYMILYTQCFSIEKIQCKKKLVFITYCFVITLQFKS